MLTEVLEQNSMIGKSPPKEGDLYRIVTTFGKTFELRYGYYEDCDRQSPLCEPVILYPDFQREPLHTEDGTPFVTLMQDACEHFTGANERTTDSTCEECKYLLQGEEWFGLCKCPCNRERKNE